MNKTKKYETPELVVEKFGINQYIMAGDGDGQIETFPGGYEDPSAPETETDIMDW